MHILSAIFLMLNAAQPDNKATDNVAV